MFAKRQPAFAGQASAIDGGPLAAAAKALRLTKPQVAVGAAAAVVLAAAGVLVLVAGDPRAGSPSVRVALNRPKPQDKNLSADAGMQAFTLDSLGLNPNAPNGDAQGGDAPPIEGTATITLPDGAGPDADNGPVVQRQSPQAAPAPTFPKLPPAVPLPAAPIAMVSQQTAMGPLPVIAPDGRTPFQLYARPFKPDGRPKVALIVGGLGLNPAATRAAIEHLPAEVTLSFVPYAQGLQTWVDLARANGHEVLLEIPMEPQDYPDNDPGPQTLLSEAPAPETVKRLEWLLSRASGYYGVANYLGQKFIASDQGMTTFMGALKQRGLGFIDDGSARRRQGALPRASADSIVDDQLSAEAIGRQLAGLEQTAKARGAALGSGFAYPVTVEVAARWAAGLQARGLQLAPASALAKR